MSWVTIIMNPNDNKVKIDWFDLKKIVLGIIQEISSSILFQKLIISTVLITIVFLSQFSDLLLSGPPFCFIFSSSIHLCPSHVDQIVGVDHYYISTFLKSLRSSCKTENYCSGITSSLIRPECQLQSIQYSGNSFPLDIS